MTVISHACFSQSSQFRWQLSHLLRMSFSPLLDHSNLKHHSQPKLNGPASPGASSLSGRTEGSLLWHPHNLISIILPLAPYLPWQLDCEFLMCRTHAVHPHCHSVTVTTLTAIITDGIYGELGCDCPWSSAQSLEANVILTLI